MSIRQIIYSNNPTDAELYFVPNIKKKKYIMTTFYSLILPFLIIVLPCTLFTIYRLNIKTNIRQKVLIVGIVLFLFGLIVPWIATDVSIKGLLMALKGSNSKCVTGAAVFLYFGYMINLIGIPFLGFIFYISGKKTENKG